MPFLLRLHAAVPPLHRAAWWEAAGISRTAAAVTSRRHSSSNTPRTSTIDKLHREETAAERIRQARQNAAQERRWEEDADSDATVSGSVATVLVHMKGEEKGNNERAAFPRYYTSALNEAVTPENALGNERDGNFNDLAESVVGELNETAHAARSTRTEHNRSKSLLRPSVDEVELADTSSEELSARTPVADLKPLPFQTLHPSVSMSELQQVASRQPAPTQLPNQIDWLKDVDDLSGHASEIVSSLRGSDDSRRSPIGAAARVTGDLPHVDIEEVLGDAVEDGSKQQVPQDARGYVRSAYAGNKASDHDYGYGDARAQEREELKATQIPYVDPAKLSRTKMDRGNNQREQQAGSEIGGTVDELSSVNDAGIVDEDALAAGFGDGKAYPQISHGRRNSKAGFAKDT